MSCPILLLKYGFTVFGDNALNFELLVWIDQPQESDAIKSAVNFLIDYEFRNRHIEIPFPQRDLWLRNPKELTQFFHNNKDDNSNGNFFTQNAKHSAELNLIPRFLSLKNQRLNRLVIGRCEICCGE
jgi:Small-conductance mechanosensitive channel